MKKMVTMLVTTALVAGFAALASAATNGWSVSLTFKAGDEKKADLLPVVLGVSENSGDAQEMLKPPPLPGSEETGNPEDAYISAYAYSAGTRQVARKIELDDTIEDAMVWVVEVDVELPEGETSRAVYLDADLSEAEYDGYDTTSVIVAIPGADDPVKQFTATTNDTYLFDSDGTPKRVFVLAGDKQKARSLAAALPDDDQIFGLTGYAGGAMDYPDIDSAQVLLKDASTCADQGSAVTVTDGIFTLDGVSDGTYVVQVDMPNFIGYECEIEVSGSDIVANTCGMLYPGDFDNNGRLNLSDIGSMKASIGTVSGDDEYDLLYDVDFSGNINLADLGEIKRGFSMSLAEHTTGTDADTCGTCGPCLLTGN